MSDFLTFIDNGSVAAFAGAFFAFLLVGATDWWRRHRRKNLIVIRVGIDRDIALRKLETAKRNIDSIRNNQASDGPVMPFPAQTLRDLQRESLDLLSADQINALDALIYWMEAIDGVFEEARRSASRVKALAREGAPNAVRAQAGGETIEHFEDAAVNLRVFRHLCQMYLDNNLSGILDIQVNRADFEHD